MLLFVVYGFRSAFILWAAAYVYCFKTDNIVRLRCFLSVPIAICIYKRKTALQYIQEHHAIFHDAPIMNAGLFLILSSIVNNALWLNQQESSLLIFISINHHENQISMPLYNYYTKILIISFVNRRPRCFYWGCREKPSRAPVVYSVFGKTQAAALLQW